MSYKNKLSTLGFTLIELLVVISIIGLISTIVLVSTKGSRDKARLAKVKQFSSQVNHALGAYAVGIWRFEEGEGIDIHDESGYGNHGTFHGNPTPVFPDGVYSGTTALQFDGVDDYVDCGNDESLDITDEITVSAWVKQSGSNNGYIVIKNTADDSKRLYSIYSKGDSDKVYFFYYDGAAKLIAWNCILDDNTWHHVAITVSELTATLYADGVSQGDKTLSGAFQGDATAKVKIGKREPDNLYFNGAIDEVRIYNRALSAAEIRNHYAAGAAKHGIAVNDY